MTEMSTRGECGAAETHSAEVVRHDDVHQVAGPSSQLHTGTRQIQLGQKRELTFLFYPGRNLIFMAV